MAILGFQVVVSMVMLSFLHKLSSRYSIARWLLTNNLIRFIHPSDEQLKGMMNGDGRSRKESNRESRRNRKQAQNGEVKEQFKIPKNTEFVLEATRVKAHDLIELKYYPEYQWLIDFGFCAAIVFLSTELFNFFLPKSVEDLNLSLVWCLLVLAFAVKWLMTLTLLYFRGDEAIGERSVCLVSSGLFFLVAMVVLIADESFLEFGLNPAYESFNASAHRLMETQGVAHNATGPMSKLIFKFCLAVWSGMIGGLFAFPGLRFAQMHKDSVLASSKSRLMVLLLQTSFIAPLFVTLLWIRPLGRVYLTEREWPERGTIMSPATFETMRLVIIILIIALRLVLSRRYLQSYLNLAPNKLAKLKKESGRIGNLELQRMIAGVYYYLCVVTLQLLSPLLILFFTTLLLKVLGNYSWAGYDLSDEDASYSNIRVNNNSLRSVFNPILFRGLLGYVTWWTSTVWFVTSVIGFVYHSYFSPTSSTSL